MFIITAYLLSSHHHCGSIIPIVTVDPSSTSSLWIHHPHRHCGSIVRIVTVDPSSASSLWIHRPHRHCGSIVPIVTVDPSPPSSLWIHRPHRHCGSIVPIVTVDPSFRLLTEQLFLGEIILPSRKGTQFEDHYYWISLLILLPTCLSIQTSPESIIDLYSELLAFQSVLLNIGLPLYFCSSFSVPLVLFSSRCQIGSQMVVTHKPPTRADSQEAHLLEFPPFPHGSEDLQIVIFRYRFEAQRTAADSIATFINIESLQICGEIREK
ncbi:hypothetical protein MJT46_006126 [Ovis ammon polii x Ovis aries]|nr:hypothetical protein MJT46_006126 [Ovis ammon polii x Ovis aries]